MSRNKVFWAAQARREMNLDLQTETMVDIRINETLQTGLLGRRCFQLRQPTLRHLPGVPFIVNFRINET